MISMGGSTRPQPPTSNCSQVISIFCSLLFKKTSLFPAISHFQQGRPQDGRESRPAPAAPAAPAAHAHLGTGPDLPNFFHAQPGPLELCESMVNPLQKNKKNVSGSCCKIEGTINNFGDVMIFWGIQKPQ